MTLIDEINKKIENKRTNGVSQKELFFYDYLSDKKEGHELDVNSSAMEKICFVAFCNTDINVEDLVKKQQNTVSMKGFHYSNNFVELIAMAIHDYQFEKEKLIRYSKNGTLKESYIINYLFPDISIRDLKESDNPLDLLIHDVLIKNEYENFGKTVVNATNFAIELIDWFIIKLAFQKAWEIHPNRKIENELKIFIEFHQNLKLKFKNKLRLIYGSALVLLIGFIVYLIFNFTVNYWDSLGLEPYFTAISLSITFISFFVPILLYRQVSGIKENFDNFIENQVSSEYFSFGVLKYKLDKIEKKYESKA